MDLCFSLGQVQPHCIIFLLNLKIPSFLLNCVTFLLTFLDAFLQYRADFPGDLQKVVVFVDLAPTFSQMADGVLTRQIQLVTANLIEVFCYLFVFGSRQVLKSEVWGKY